MNIRNRLAHRFVQTVARPLVRPLALSALVVSATVVVPVAGAAPADIMRLDREAPSIVIRFADLDLSRTEDAGDLYQRIRRAARRVCYHSGFLTDGKRTSNWQHCYDVAVENAVRDVDRRTLTALHLSKTGQSERWALAEERAE